MREHWMRLLNPFIAHKRLSEIYIPGSHDAAAYDCLRESGVVFSDISTIQVFYGRINNDAVSSARIVLYALVLALCTQRIS